MGKSEMISNAFAVYRAENIECFYAPDDDSVSFQSRYLRCSEEDIEKSIRKHERFLKEMEFEETKEDTDTDSGDSKEETETPWHKVHGEAVSGDVKERVTNEHEFVADRVWDQSTLRVHFGGETHSV